jgi:anti-anti-sigma factor
MEFSFGLSDDALVVTPVGRVDEATWEEFGAKLSDGIDIAGREARRLLIVDLSQTDYMSSRGLRALSVARNKANATNVAIRLAAPNEVMREIIAISRYDRLFVVDDDAPVGVRGVA